MSNLFLDNLFLDNLSLYLAQSVDQSQSDPLIATGSEHVIDFGVVILVFAVIFAIGAVSKKTKEAVLFGLALAACLMVILWVI